jgi:hypothetical protein
LEGTESPIFERRPGFVNEVDGCKVFGCNLSAAWKRAGFSGEKIFTTLCDSHHGPTFPHGRHFDSQHWFRGRVRKPSSSRLSRGSSGKGKPRLASFVQGSPVAARYRPPASATGTRYYLVIVICKRLRGDDFLRGRFLFWRENSCLDIVGLWSGL